MVLLWWRVRGHRYARRVDEVSRPYTVDMLRFKASVAKTRSYLRLLRCSLHPRLALANAVCAVLPDFFSGVARGRLYRLAGFDIGPGVFIMGKVELPTGIPDMYEKLSVGAGTVISTNVTINLDAPVRIGDNVCISPYVLIYTGGHRVGPPWRRMGEVTTRPVTIEYGAWIRLGAIILPGVTVGHGSIVGAGAVVFEDVPPDTYMAGNPAQVVRELR